MSRDVHFERLRQVRGWRLKSCLIAETGDEEAPAEVKAEQPPLGLVVQHEGPAMVLDQMPEIAIDALAHLPEAAREEAGASGDESAAGSSNSTS